MTAYQAYRSMSWTSDADTCDDCSTVLKEGAYKEGRIGHYCSKKCRARAEAGENSDERASERRQMGIV